MGEDLTVVDLFCGAGGFSKGFEMAGLKVIAGLDIDRVALETFWHNHKNAERIEPYNLKGETLDSVVSMKPDIVIGSPPCKGFSDARGARLAINDPMNQLVFHFARWLSETQPKIAVMENVSGMLTIDDAFINGIKKKIEASGYSVRIGMLNSADFGVPQKRMRVFVLGFRSDLGISPSFPTPTHFDKGQATLIGASRKYVTVGDAISDLPSPTKDGEAKIEEEPQNEFQKTMRRGAGKTVYNHVAKYPDKKQLLIVKRIPEGKMYRTSRFGEKCVPVWEVFKDKLTREEKDILHFIARNRTKNNYKIAQGKYAEGYVPAEVIASELGIAVNDIESLYRNKWLRRIRREGILAYDINTKSGIRPIYIRLSRYEPSPTILTRDFSPREKLHPTEHRGLSLREGARIQSFPDSFVFKGDFREVATQIGNAVPPLLAKALGEHIRKLLEREVVPIEEKV